MRRRSVNVWLVATLLLPFASSCGSAKHQQVTPSVESLAQAACSFAYRCCQAGEVAYYLQPFVTEDNCAERILDATEDTGQVDFTLSAFPGLAVVIPNAAALDRAVNDGRTSIDSKALQACTDYLSTLACNAPPVAAVNAVPAVCTPPTPPVDDTPCDPTKIFIGKLKEGDTCTSLGGAFECGPGLHCSTDADFGTEGECVRFSQEGEFCSDATSGGSCADGLYCSGLDGKCHTPAGPGDTCVYGDRNVPPDPATLLTQCRSDLSCDWLTSTCVVACQDGATCSTDDDCDATAQLKCLGIGVGLGAESFGTGRCGVPRAAGVPCTVPSDCADTLTCAVDPTDSTRSVCQAKIATGSPCGATSSSLAVDANEQCVSGFCDVSTGTCAPQVTPPGLCPSGDSAQCAGGTCVGAGTYCSADTDCPGGSGKCDTTRFECVPYCVALKPDGAICALDTDCQSSACVAGFCAKPPLASGEACTESTQCTSGFCGLETSRVCTTLPLDTGSACSSNDQCATLVCYGAPPGLNTGGTGGLLGGGTTSSSTCTAGLSAGDLCGASLGKPPCDPKALYCDSSEDPPRCAPFVATGEPCLTNEQCRGQCVDHGGWKVCNDTPPAGSVSCSGNH